MLLPCCPPQNRLKSSKRSISGHFLSIRKSEKRPFQKAGKLSIIKPSKSLGAHILVRVGLRFMMPSSQPRTEVQEMVVVEEVRDV